MRVYNTHTAPIAGIGPGEEGELTDEDKDNPAFQLWLKGDPDKGVQPLLVPASSRAAKAAKKENAAASIPPGDGTAAPEDVTPRVGDKTGTRK